MGKKGKSKYRVTGSALNDLARVFHKKHKNKGHTKYNKRKPADVWAALENDKPVLSSFTTFRQNFQARLLRKKNAGEKACEALMKHITPKYEREKYVQAKGTFYFIDFFVREIDGTPVSIALEIDGSIHDKEEVKKNDRRREQYLINRPWISAVLRITSEKVREMTFAELKTALLTCTHKKITRIAHTPKPRRAAAKNCLPHTCTFPDCSCK